MASGNATKSDWTIFPLPEETVKIPLSYKINAEELEQLRKGVIPQGMEDKWFVYCEPDFAYFHRSWTGILVYKIKIDPLPTGGALLSEVEVNNHPEQYKCQLVRNPVAANPGIAGMHEFQSASFGVEVPKVNSGEIPELQQVHRMIEWVIQPGEKLSYLGALNKYLRDQDSSST